jgi:hypothetical protein
VNSLCDAPQEDPLPPYNDLGQLENRFNEYFFRKIELIRENVDRIVAEPPLVEYRNPEINCNLLSHFLSRIFMMLLYYVIASASCKLDLS